MEEYFDNVTHGITSQSITAIKEAAMVVMRNDPDGPHRDAAVSELLEAAESIAYCYLKHPGE
jgi:hypothetical protein